MPQPASKRSRKEDEALEGLPRKVGVHIFTRDFRLEDSRPLMEMTTLGLDELRFVFVFTPEQTEQSKEKGYFAEASFCFMVRALRDLEHRVQKQLGKRLEVYFGATADVVRALHADQPEGTLHAVSMAEDYTPYAKKREAELQTLLSDLDVKFVLREDHCLTPTGLHDITSGTGTHYKVFTPFYNKASNVKPPPTPLDYDVSVLKIGGEKSSALRNDHSLKLKYSCEDAARAFLKSGFKTKELRDNVACATREFARRRLSEYNFGEYSHNRNHLDKTSTNLSAHFKYGLVSAREVRSFVVANTRIPQDEREAFVRQLYWRDFYMYVTLHNPGILQKQVAECENANFAPNLGGLPWSSSNEDFQRWLDGKTGVPFVDAAMREMNHAGTMHNRGRMVAAMFLTKNLMIDWRKGEQVFCNRLVDYDPCNNNGGWQWSSSTGADGAPYFRIMNPEAQMAKVDPTLAYIKKWIPELKAVPKADVLSWTDPKVHSKYVGKAGFKYFAPMVCLRTSRARAIDLFKKTIANNKAEASSD